jgi:hypothetical protein
MDFTRKTRLGGGTNAARTVLFVTVRSTAFGLRCVVQLLNVAVPDVRVVVVVFFTTTQLPRVCTPAFGTTASMNEETFTNQSTTKE